MPSRAAFAIKNLHHILKNRSLPPREVLKFLQIIADTKPLAGMEIVECSPPYDATEITSLMATRVICDVLACQVRSGNLLNRKKR